MPETHLARLADHSLSDTRRLIAALALSCLAHSAMVILPYLGESRQQATAAIQERLAPLTLAAILVDGASLGRPKPRPPQAARPQAPPPVVKKDARTMRKAGIEAREAEIEDKGRKASGLPFPAPRYYPASELDKRPRLLTPIELDPPEIRRVMASGKIILLLWINDLGQVVETAVEDNELPEIFSEAARSVFLHARFVPGELHGQAVNSLMRIEISYDDERLKGR